MTILKKYQVDSMIFASLLFLFLFLFVTYRGVYFLRYPAHRLMIFLCILQIYFFSVHFCQLE